MQFLEQVPLGPFTTFQIGGPARWFAEAASEEDIAAGIAFAAERQLPLFVLGGGSNLLVSDTGFPGLVLRMALQGIASTPEKGRVIVSSAAGKIGMIWSLTRSAPAMRASSASPAFPAQWAARRCRMSALMGRRFRKPS